MGKISLNYDLGQASDGETSLLVLAKSDFDKFNPSLLQLGPTSQQERQMDALAAIFDLEGFTEFCSQPDPHLIIPDFLSRFLEWLFAALSAEVTIGEGETEDEIFVWAPLPFFGKFLGDGALFLWDVQQTKVPQDLGNVVIALRHVCDKYVTDLLPRLRRRFVRPPNALRCGVAMGRVISLGGGADYIGSCINMAARLQKLAKLPFAVSLRGFDPERCFDRSAARRFITRRHTVRGIGDDELIMILKDDFDALSSVDQAEFFEPGEVGEGVQRK